MTTTGMNERGFTLTELIITIAIVVILAALAIPNYRGHVLRSQRSDAMAALLRIAAAQEKFYLQNNTYTNTLGDGGLALADTSANENYQLVVRNADLQGFEAEASATGGQAADDQCVFFSLDEQGERTARNGDGDDTTDLCWR